MHACYNIYYVYVCVGGGGVRVCVDVCMCAHFTYCLR